MTDGRPICPVCGAPYEMRYPRTAFTPAMVDDEDEVCRSDRFVHVHGTRGDSSPGRTD